MVQALGLLFNEDKQPAVQVAQEIKEWLEQKGIRVILNVNRLHGADAAIILGGDGTLLRAARGLCKLGVPILGVNLGHLGFLTEIELPDLYPSLAKLLAGDYFLEERMMLLGSVLRGETTISEGLALNDVVVSRGDISRIITLDISLAGEPLFTYPADGIIVATPTGSTAYSLSAGGPIVSPLVKSMTITPICPHTLSARTMVVDPSQLLQIRFLRGIDCVVTFDGQQTVELQPGDVVEIKRATVSTNLIKLSGRSFSEVLRAKLRDSLHA